MYFVFPNDQKINYDIYILILMTSKYNKTFIHNE